LSRVRSPGVGTAEDLVASAMRRAGLEDFGADDFRDGLDVLVESYRRDAALTPLGARMSRAEVRGALVSRLCSEAAFRQYPEHAGVAIERPVVVLGLPRTGSTALHRLLAADPANQGLEMWLAQAPQPRPARETWTSHPVYAALSDAYARHRSEHPEFAAVHLVGADEVEECWQLLRQSMRSVSFECLACLPTYSAWLRAQDWAAAYRRHRRNLQLIGFNDTARRWVLKNPSHLFALDALLAAYPDALVIQTHRDPRVAIASACSLAAHATAGWSDVFRGEVIGASQLELWATGLDRFVAARARHQSSPHNRASFCDVEYDGFVTDPLVTVESVYDQFGLVLTGAAADAMRRLAAGSTSGGSAQPHKYALADFGLSGEQVDERFGGYRRRDSATADAPT